MADSTGAHDSGTTSDSPRSGYGGKHSSDKATTPRTDAGTLLGRNVNTPRTSQQSWVVRNQQN